MSLMYCQAFGCLKRSIGDTEYCVEHIDWMDVPVAVEPPKQSMADLYPKYYKRVPKDWESMDTYAVNKLFPVDDPSGAILHARKKLLVPGTRTGGKTMRQDITEARDTLNRWLELNKE